MKQYLRNCFLLLIPILLWNIILSSRLPVVYSPEIFWNDIPTFISYSENIFRIIIFILPAFMILSIKTSIQKMGLFVYTLGILIYFSSWIAVIYFQESQWSNSILGLMAPAYTSLFWLVGIGLLGQKSFIRIPKTSMLYLALSALFVFFHTWHTYIVFQR